jgi:hypothetical protein
VEKVVARRVRFACATFEMHRRRVVVGVPFLRADVTTYERQRSCVPRFPTRWHASAIHALSVGMRVACD